MNATELNETRDVREGKSNQKLEILNDKEHLVEGSRKYEMFSNLRIKLGKTKEEFQRIFELYDHLLRQQNP
jgi:hypothetical protein